MPLPEILADLSQIARTFDMTQNGLGKSLCQAFTDGVQVTLAAQQSPAGTPWPPLSPTYAEWKGRFFPGQPMAHLHDVMADPAEVAGEVVIRPDSAEATYGRSEVARDEASWFQEGGGNQPPRPFWGFTASSRDAVRVILTERLKQSVNG